MIVCPAQEAVGYTGVTKSCEYRKPILTISMCRMEGFSRWMSMCIYIEGKGEDRNLQNRNLP